MYIIQNKKIFQKFVEVSIAPIGVICGHLSQIAVLNYLGRIVKNYR
jgi:hypothetical protein